MPDYSDLGHTLVQYCEKYKVPINNVFDILNDQKVVPMIRGKATEYNVYLFLLNLLNNREWSVDKLNLNPQPGTDDEDISITHKRTGIIIKIECKNAVRGSISNSKRSKIKVPHLNIKCHRSRSNTKKLKSGNDKYLVEDFDIIVSNMSNAIIKGASVDENFEIVDKNNIKKILAGYYKVGEDFNSLFDASAEDWRFVVTSDIAEGGFIPRTPVVLLENDPNWKPLNMIEHSLLELVKAKNAEHKDRRTRK